MSDKRVQLWCLHSVFVFITLFLIGWVLLARMVPPPSPMETPREIAQFYGDNIIGIRIGFVIAIFASALLLPWGSAICTDVAFGGPSNTIDMGLDRRAGLRSNRIRLPVHILACRGVPSRRRDDESHSTEDTIDDHIAAIEAEITTMRSMA
jgi:hypothetical protein